GGIDLWVRTDGNDETGDGTRNSADRAFRTIMGAWRSVGERFMATPLFTANIKLGIPGVYESAYVGPFGSNLTISGGGYDGGNWGGGNRWDYQIQSGYYAGEDIWLALAFSACNSVGLYGITMLNSYSAKSSALLWGAGSNGMCSQCAFNAYGSH